MLRNWLRNSILFCAVLGYLSGLSQKLDTLTTFEVTEVLSDLKTFSKIELALDSSSSNSLDQLLAGTPIYLKDYGQGQLATLSIRGNGASQTQVFWNGFKMNSPTLGQTDLSLIPVFFLSEASVNYSGGSSANGSGGIGGSVNLGNRLVWKKGFNANAGIQFASFSNSTSRIQLSFGQKNVFHQIKVLSKKGENDFSFADLSKIEKPTVYQQNNRINQLGAQYELGVKLNKKNLIQGIVLMFNSFREIPPIIGAISNRETQQDNSVKSFVSWKSFQKNFSSELRLSYFNEKLNYTDSVSSIFSKSIIHSYQAQLRNKLKLLKAFDLETSLGNALYKAQSTGFLKEKTRNEASVYVKISETLPKLYYEVFARQELIDTALSPLTFGGGFDFLPFKKKKVSFKGNIASVYRVPTLNDLYWANGGNESLSPEKGWNSELTIGYKPINHKSKEWNISVSGFYNQTDNWIQWVPISTGIWSPRNVKEIRNLGTDFTVEYSYRKEGFGLDIIGFYSYTNSRNIVFVNSQTELENKTPIYIPTHKATILFRAEYKKISVSYNQMYNGRVFLDESNSAYMPHYFPANLAVTYPILIKEHTLRLTARINNLYNEPFQVVANRPIAGRNYLLDISFFL